MNVAGPKAEKSVFFNGWDVHRGDGSIESMEFCRGVVDCHAVQWCRCRVSGRSQARPQWIESEQAEDNNRVHAGHRAVQDLAQTDIQIVPVAADGWLAE